MNRIFQIMLVYVAATIMLAQCAREASDQPQTEATPGSIEALTTAISENPEDPENYIARARYNFERENYGDAIQDIATAMRYDSINENYHHLLADVYMESLRSQLALNTMERAVRLFPESIDSWLKIAEIQIILQQYEAASGSIRKALEINPRDVDALYLLAILFKEQDNIDGAIQSLQTVTEIDGDHYEAWTMLGNLLDIKGDPMALQCFENAIDIDSTYPQGWHSKAFYLQNNGQIDEALQIYDKLHSIAPGYTDAYLNAGILHLEREEAGAAQAEFQMLVDQDPDNPIGHYYLGVTDEATGNYDDALAHYQEASRLSPGTVRFGQAAERVKAEISTGN